MEIEYQENIAKLQSRPPSSSSSPSHEFTFTTSINPIIPSKLIDSTSANSKSIITTNPNNPLHYQPYAIDLSPADDIFYHGHLLPLRHLSDLPISPRSSTNSLDSFTLPIKELEKDNLNRHNSEIICSKVEALHRHQQSKSFQVDSTRFLLQDGKGTIKEKSKSFSLFTNRRKPPLPLGEGDKRKEGNKGIGSKKWTFEVVKRYLSSFNKFLSSSTKRKGNDNKNFEDQGVVGRPYSLSSGNLRAKKSKKELRGKRGELSAPASMGASPTNSGRLIARGTISPIMSKSDSTMDELQAAIQAAIAHCKKSIAAEDAINFP